MIVLLKIIQFQSIFQDAEAELTRILAEEIDRAIVNELINLNNNA